MPDESRDLDTGVSDRRMNELTARLTEQLPTRRKFLAGSAAAGGGLLALSLGGAGAAAADGDDHGNGDDGEGGDREGGDGAETQDVEPIDVLNYALTLEKLEATFYEEGLARFNQQDFAEAEFAGRLSEDVSMEVHPRLLAVRNHEQAHVDVISSTIQDLGGEPVSGLQFEFPYENPDEFVELGRVLENTGVAAYAGAAPLIENPDLLAAAVSIHSVEARHASYLNHLTDVSPFPTAFDEAQSMAEVQEAVSGFIVSDGGGGMGGDDGSKNGGSGNGGH